MEPTKVYPIVALLSLVTVEYGGWALLSFITSRQGQLSDVQSGFRSGVRRGPSLISGSSPTDESISTPTRPRLTATPRRRSVVHQRSTSPPARQRPK